LRPFPLPRLLRHEVTGLSEPDLARLVRKDRIDILVELTGEVVCACVRVCVSACVRVCVRA